MNFAHAINICVVHATKTSNTKLLDACAIAQRSVKYSRGSLTSGLKERTAARQLVMRTAQALRAERIDVVTVE